MFCVCERSFSVNSRMVAKARNLNADDVKKEWVDSLLPGVQIVPAGVWAIKRAQIWMLLLFRGVRRLDLNKAYHALT